MGIPGRENHQAENEKTFCVLKSRRKIAMCNELREPRGWDWRSKYGINQWGNIAQKSESVSCSVMSNSLRPYGL